MEKRAWILEKQAILKAWENPPSVDQEQEFAVTYFLGVL